MKSHLFIVLFFFGALGLSGQSLLVEGVIQDEETTLLPFAHILNLSSGTGTVSTTNGYFSIFVKNGDTLRISFTGYKKLFITVDDEILSRPIQITLSPEYIELPSLWVFANPKYLVPKKFKGKPMKIAGLPESNTKSKSISPGSLRFDASPSDALTFPILPIVGVTISGPFSYFTPEEKEKRMAKLAYLETKKTITFSRHLALQLVREQLKMKFELDDKELDKMLVQMNQEQPAIQNLTNTDLIMSQISAFIATHRYN